MRKEAIKMKKEDLDQAIVRGLGRAVWENKKQFSTASKIHANRKRKLARHKKTEVIDD
ncbi:MAG: hypothetical protein WC146_00475 [Patescibacteria group bacterium]